MKLKAISLFFNLQISDFVRNTHANANRAPTLVGTFIEFSNNYKKKQKTFDIFFSLRCSPAMIKLATEIKFKLEKKFRCTIFLCTVNAKTTFYDEIHDAIMKCSFFVPFIDFDWCQSEECGDEKNLADNLSKHSQPRKPVIIPIVFNQKGVLNHKRCKPLTSTWNSIFVDMNHVDMNYIYNQLSSILFPEVHTK